MAMDASERMLIERECARLVTLYCHHVDHGEAGRVVELFSADSVWRAGNVVMEGQEQLAKGFGARQANRARMSRHVCNNLLIDVIDAHNARGTVYLTLYRHDGEEGRQMSPLTGPQLVGEYRDRFVRTPDGWRFAERELEASFVRAEEGAG
jgi:hypothetical protein